MRSVFVQFWILALFFFIAGEASAKGGKLTMELSTVYAQHSFSGFDGADFSSVAAPGYDLSFRFLRGNQAFMLGYFTTPQIKFTKVRWSDQTTGDYTLDYTTPYLGFSPSTKNKKFSFDFLMGFESISFAGSPEVGYKDSPGIMLGVKFGTNLKAKWKWAKNLVFPVSGRMWFTQKRDFEFADKPAENSSINSGTSFDLMVGVAFNVL